MNADNTNIQDFLGSPKTVFVVPVYQRNYDWKSDNCKQLFDDIVAAVNSQREHFLGVISFKTYSSKERAIIDGQQRLTSVTLMLKAVHDYVDDDDLRAEIAELYLYNKHNKNDDFKRYKLHLNKQDNTVYQILLANNKETVANQLTEIQKNTRVYQNYALFYDLISDYVEKGGAPRDITEILSSLTIVELEIEDENPQEIFESLNSTGLNLTSVDLLRNHFLMRFPHDEQTKLYEQYWFKIENAVGVDNMEQFFIDYLVFRRRSNSIMINGRNNKIALKNLQYSIKEFFANLPQIDNFEKTSFFFSDLAYCSSLYKNFIFPSDFVLDKKQPLQKKLYFMLSVNDNNSARCLLLYLFDLNKRGLITEKDLNEAVDAVVTLSFRAKICNMKGVDRQFSGNVMARLDELNDYQNFIDMFWHAITFGKGSYAFPTDDQFMKALTEEDALYKKLRSNGMKYLLYALDWYAHASKELPSFSSSDITIEHIMPQTLSAHWRSSLSKETMENYDSLLHSLGNLALTGYNPELSNNSFDDKKKYYINSSFYYTKIIANNADWQIEQINERAKAMAEDALKIWAFPGQYQKTRTMTKSFHKLSEDQSQFVFQSPRLLLIDTDEYPVKHWADLLPRLCAHLFKDNKEVFLNIASPDNFAVFKIEDSTNHYSDNVDYYPIVDNLFVKAVGTSEYILKTMLKIAKAYDELAGTEYADSIVFSLK